MPVPKTTTLPRFKTRHWKDARGWKHTAYYYELPTLEDGTRPLKPLGTDRVVALREYAKLEEKPESAVGLSDDDFSVRAIYLRYMTWAEIKANSGLAARTISDRKKYWKKLKPVFGNEHIDSLVPEHMLRYYDKRSSKSQAKKEIKFVSVFCGWGRGRGWMKAANPVTKDVIKQMKVNESRTVYVTDGLYWMVHSCGDWLVKDTLDFALLNYLRPAEAFRPGWIDMHRDAKGGEEIWHTLPKTEKSGVRIKRVRVVGPLKDLIARIRARTVRGKTILCDEAGQPLKAQGKFRYRFYKAREAAQVKLRELLEKHDEAWLIERGLPVPPPLVEGRADKFLTKLIQFRDMRPKSATDSARRDGMPETRKRLAHTTEKQTADYVRDQVGELVDPSMAEQPEWLKDELLAVNS